MGRIAALAICGVLASFEGAAASQAPIQPVYNAMGAFSSGMLNVVQIGQPLAFQARNARLRAEAQRGQTEPQTPPGSMPLTFAPGDGADTVNAYLARLSTEDPAAATQLRTALAGQNVPAIFAQVVAPFGLGNHDVADAMAAHLIMRAMVATGAQPPSPQGVRNVRASVAQALAHDPKITSDAYRRQIGGEAQLDFVLINTSWRAMEAGKWPAGAAAQFRQNIAANLAQEGLDLSKTRLSADGFVPM